VPAKSEKQRRFAAMSASPEGRRKLKAEGKKPMPEKAAKEFRRKK